MYLGDEIIPITKQSAVISDGSHTFSLSSPSPSFQNSLSSEKPKKILSFSNYFSPSHTVPMTPLIPFSSSSSSSFSFSSSSSSSSPSSSSSLRSSVSSNHPSSSVSHSPSSSFLSSPIISTHSFIVSASVLFCAGIVIGTFLWKD